jgi:hypothetical protein
MEDDHEDFVHLGGVPLEDYDKTVADAKLAMGKVSLELEALDQIEPSSKEFVDKCDALIDTIKKSRDSFDAVPDHDEQKQKWNLIQDVYLETVNFKKFACQSKLLAEASMRKAKDVQEWARDEKQTMAEIYNKEFDTTVIAGKGYPQYLRCGRITDINEKANKYTQLLTYLQLQMRVSGVRRKGDRVYKRVANAGKVSTAAWQDAGSLESFMYNLCHKSVNPKMWEIVAQPGEPIATAAKYFEHSGDPDCKEITRVKWIFSFENGVYDAWENAFHAYPLDAAHSDTYSKNVPAKHFENVVFPADMWEMVNSGEMQWQDIPTDAVDGLFSYQEIDREAIDWMYVTVGRLMHDVGVKDNFGYVGMIVGAAGTGKSTFCLHLAKLWEPDDVGVLSNNCERQWAIGAFVDKFLIIAPEIKSDLRLDQAEWQGMTTGDPMSIARKHRDARTVKWKVPAFFAGNQIPDWVDHGGSVLRRILLWRFEKKVKSEDGGMPKKLEDELPYFILKCAVAYKKRIDDNTHRFGGSCANLWESVPEYFKEQRKRLSVMLNPLESFINDRIVKGEDQAVPYDAFKAALSEYCKENGFGTYRMSGDNYVTIFNEHGFSVKTIPYTGENISARNTKCVLGCRLKNDCDNMVEVDDRADMDGDAD